VADPRAGPHELLGGATTRIIYDLFAFRRTRASAAPQPACSATMARDTHSADLTPGAATTIQHRVTFSDGFGREIQVKASAAADSAGPRWIGSGWRIHDNKGNVVREYEPFFSATSVFEFGRASGTSVVRLYDPMQRVIATLHPDRSWDKARFDPWRRDDWDGN